MAKCRMIKTNFWKDPYIENLDPSEKLMYLYIFTNDQVTLCGIYELSKRRASFDTWFDKDMIQKILKRFERDNKLILYDDYVGIVNFMKNQSKNPSVLKWIIRSIREVPAHILKWLWIDLEQAVTGCTQAAGNLTLLNLTLPNLTKPNSKLYIEDLELNDLFLDFLDMRKKIKKPATDRAIKTLLKKLEELSKWKHERKKLIIEQSIVNNRQDLFELKNPPKRKIPLLVD